MTRNLKILGLALGAMLVMGALSASVASAQEQGVLTGGPVTLTGEAVGEPNENRFTAFGGFLQCPGSTGTGHKLEETPHELIPSGATEITLTPHIKEADAEGAPNCKGPLGTTATTDFNGCDYVVNAGETAGEEGTYEGTVDVVCPPEKEILWTLWTSEEEHTNEPNEPFCVLRVADEDAEGNPTNQGLTGAHATDEGNGHVKVAGKGAGIHVRREVIAPHEPSLLCSNGATENASLDLNVTISGHDAEGKERAVSLSH